MRTVILILAALRDLFGPYLPVTLQKMLFPRMDFAFMIHPPLLEDASRKYPFFRERPKLAAWFFRRLWPVTCSYITTGITNPRTGKPLRGVVVGFSLWADALHSDTEVGKKKAIRTVRLARAYGCQYIGLGALIPWLTHGGQDLVDADLGMHIVTGHAYTVGAIGEILLETRGVLRLEISKLTIAVLGAAGHMGQPSARLIAEMHPHKLLLADLPSKEDVLEGLREEIAGLCSVEVTTDNTRLVEADVIVVVTNATRTIVHADHLKHGAIVIDDTHPPNISRRLLQEREDVLILGVAVRAPRIQMNFRFALPENFIYTCAAGVSILAARGHEGNYDVAGQFSVKDATDIVEWGKEHGIGPTVLQGFQRIIQWHKLRAGRTSETRGGRAEG